MEISYDADGCAVPASSKRLRDAPPRKQRRRRRRKVESGSDSSIGSMSLLSTSSASNSLDVEADSEILRQEPQTPSGEFWDEMFDVDMDSLITITTI